MARLLRCSTTLLGSACRRTLIDCPVSLSSAAVKTSWRAVSTSMFRPSDFDYTVTEDEMSGFIERCMLKAGTAPDQIGSVVRMILDADRRGHYSHGLNRLPMYIRDVQTGTCKAAGKPSIVKQKGGTALVDGDNALGSVVGEFCTNLAIDLAREHGISLVSAFNSNHYGTAGRYSQMASDAGLIGVSYTNTSPLVYPTRSAQKAIGTNPLSFYAPAQNGDRFALDMATTTVALGKIELCHRKKYTEMPQGWGADGNGVQSTSPDTVLNGGGLLPLGGVEVTGGYKGTGLGVMVDILGGVLAGAHYGKNVRKWQDVGKQADLGQGFLVIDPSCFADGFAPRLQTFLNEIRGLKPVDPELPVRIPGDLSRGHIEKSAAEGGLLYNKNQIEYTRELAKELGVECFKAEPYSKKD